MTGISDVYKNAKQVYSASMHWLLLLRSWMPAWLFAILLDHLPNLELDTVDSREKGFLIDCRNSMPGTAMDEHVSHEPQLPDGRPLRWGLLLPICSR